MPVRACASFVALLAMVGVAAACGAPRPPSYAAYGEYAKDSNKLMKGGLNRRVFNKVESQAGSDITLNADGSISLEPGTYHISGASTVTMQTTFAPPTIKNDNNYPGYAMIYTWAAKRATITPSRASR